MYPRIVIDDEFQGYSADCIRLPLKYKNYIEGILVSNGLIKDRLEQMASDIIDSLERRGSSAVTLICILKGGFKFASDLTEKMESVAFFRRKNISIYIDFIVANTYVNDDVGHETHLRVCSDPEKFRHKDLIVVEDLIDTGTTMYKLVSYLKSLEPRSVEVASLLVKRRPDCNAYVPDYVGFEVPNRFIVGYAIDYNDQFRELPHVCVVNDEGKRRFKLP
ncbi:unnamed protein product [Calicophoron daubneyi]|uniref:Phosphoribosyltransferase domain-containing protein n=1 Tax=Calicophoron daubneyi TaxID=300641 RepID=A0AAV2T7J3_CALDB